MQERFFLALLAFFEMIRALEEENHLVLPALSLCFWGGKRMLQPTSVKNNLARFLMRNITQNVFCP